MIPAVFQEKSELRTTVTVSCCRISDPRAIPGTSGSPTDLVLTRSTSSSGFVTTLFAYFMLDERYRVPRFEMPTLDPAYWLRSSTQIWILWILGGALVVAGWLRWLTARVGWLGLAMAMVGVIASWFADEPTRHLAIQIGTAIVSALLIVMAWRGDLVSRMIRPGDYEAELVALCGNRWLASRLIREERKRRPSLSRAGAALAAVTRVRHERDPRPSL